MTGLAVFGNAALRRRVAALCAVLVLALSASPAGAQESPGINTESLAELYEGRTVDFDVTLHTQPTGNVTVTPTIANTSVATITPSSVTFTPGDWDKPQTFTIHGTADDTNTIERRTTFRLSASAGYGAADVTVNVLVTDQAAQEAAAVCAAAPGNLQDAKDAIQAWLDANAQQPYQTADAAWAPFGVRWAAAEAAYNASLDAADAAYSRAMAAADAAFFAALLGTDIDVVAIIATLNSARDAAETAYATAVDAAVATLDAATQTIGDEYDEATLTVNVVIPTHLIAARNSAQNTLDACP